MAISEPRLGGPLLAQSPATPTSGSTFFASARRAVLLVLVGWFARLAVARSEVAQAGDRAQKERLGETRDEPQEHRGVGVARIELQHVVDADPCHDEGGGGADHRL